MELRHLRYFATIAEERHFGRAAVRLHMTQPPLSRQIQELEEELGFVLFERSRRQVELTPAGVVFLDHVRRVFESLDLAVHEARRASVGELGRIVVGNGNPAPQVIAITMGVYLCFSLVISALTNVVNRRLQVVSR